MCMLCILRYGHYYLVGILKKGHWSNIAISSVVRTEGKDSIAYEMKKKSKISKQHTSKSYSSVSFFVL